MCLPGCLFVCHLILLLVCFLFKLFGPWSYLNFFRDGMGPFKIQPTDNDFFGPKQTTGTDNGYARQKSSYAE